jgi:hypothetical protein
VQNRGEVGNLREKDDDERKDEGVGGEVVVPIIVSGLSR